MSRTGLDHTRVKHYISINCAFYREPTPGLTRPSCLQALPKSATESTHIERLFRYILKSNVLFQYEFDTRNQEDPIFKGKDLYIVSEAYYQQYPQP